MPAQEVRPRQRVIRIVPEPSLAEASDGPRCVDRVCTGKLFAGKEMNARAVMRANGGCEPTIDMTPRVALEVNDVIARRALQA